MVQETVTVNAEIPAELGDSDIHRVRIPVFASSACFTNVCSARAVVSGSYFHSWSAVPSELKDSLGGAMSVIGNESFFATRLYNVRKHLSFILQRVHQKVTGRGASQ